MTYERIKKLIKNGNYNKVSMKTKLDVFLLSDSITKEEYNELMDMME